MKSTRHECGNESCAQCISRHWNTYNRKRTASPEVVDDYMDELPEAIQKEFDLSKKPIIDFGVSTGEQHQYSLKRGRTVIGYDYDQQALNSSKKLGIETREVNLNDFNSADELLSDHALKQDLAEPADIFLVYVLEYLKPQAVIVLLCALIDAAKPGTCFYIKSKIYQERHDSMVNFMTLFPRGYIPSFFADRPDILLVRHEYEKIVTDGPVSREFENEQVVLRKC